MDVNLQKYEALIKTVEYGSFTKAADELSYSQSGISRMIADLEKEWGIILLERDRSGVRITSDGMKLLPFARKLCENYRQMRDEVDALKGIQSGFIRIGTISSTATHWIPNIIARFRQDYPDIDYELLPGDYTEIENWIEEGRVDCGFLSLPTRPEFETILLDRDELVAVLPENHPLVSKSFVRAEDLLSDPFMLLDKGKRSEFAAVFERRGLQPDVRYTTWDDNAVLSMVEHGLGISIMSKLVLRRMSFHVEIRSLDPPEYRELGLALRNRKSVSSATQKFLTYLSYRNQS
ncbi:MAG: LysR family transcriptional regulator [Lachnospiraceae bacterium]|nr:LysR family transcriptional regulator [Lachnospiraceae bacterium]